MGTGTTSPNIMRDLAWDLMATAHPSRRGVFRTAYQAMCEVTTQIVSNVKRVATTAAEEHETAPECIAPRSRFREAIRRIELSHAYAPTITENSPYGFYRGRPIIGESTPVNGGIYLSATAQEAVVVDVKYGALQGIADKLLARCAQIESQTTTFEYEVFSKAVLLTRETLRFSEEGVLSTAHTYQIRPDDKVTLDLYVKRKVGVARHQVLLVAFLLERLREEGVIRGRPTIEGLISAEIPQERLLFSSAEGEVFRFDPTKGLGKTAIH